jgi:hypothetical protein
MVAPHHPQGDHPGNSSRGPGAPDAAVRYTPTARAGQPARARASNELTSAAHSRSKPSPSGPSRLARNNRAPIPREL